MNDPDTMTPDEPEWGERDDEAVALLVHAWGWALFVVPAQFACIGFMVVVVALAIAFSGDVGVLARVVSGVIGVGVWGLMVLRCLARLRIVAGTGPAQPSPWRTRLWWLGMWATALSLPGWMLWAALFVLAVGERHGAALTPWAVTVLACLGLGALGPLVGAVVLWRTGNGRELLRTWVESGEEPPDPVMTSGSATHLGR